MAIATTNPATGEIEKTFEALSDAEVDERIARAAATAVEYRRTSFADRARWMNAAADYLDSAVEEIARVMTTEMGKTIVAARAEVKKCAKGCRFYAEHAEAMLADEPADAAAVGASRAYVRYEPLGPVLAVMPWNFPLWQVIRFAAPALMAGNVGLLKHASNVPQTALLIEEAFRRGGFPDGAFQTLLIGSSSVERILRDPRVRAATLTGSTPAGRSIGRIAGEELKPVVLELGGSDPYVVMPSADLEKAAADRGDRARAEQRTELHRGQALHRARRRRRRVRGVVRRPHDRRSGSAIRWTSRPTSVRWPTSRACSTSRSTWPTRLRAAPASCVVAHESIGRAGSIRRRSSPTSRPEMSMYHEEIFGPVAQLFRVERRGRGDRAGERDRLRARIEHLDARRRGTRSLRRLARGGRGVRQRDDHVVSRAPVRRDQGVGFGRELSAQGIRSFCNVKTVWVG